MKNKTKYVVTIFDHGGNEKLLHGVANDSATRATIDAIEFNKTFPQWRFGWTAASGNEELFSLWDSI